MSLSTLSMVINQLSKDTQPPEQSEQTVYRTAACTGPRKGQYPPRIPQPTNQTTHVSFRNSKLTRLLESTLRGEAYITMICNVTIANLVETKSTLNFAKTAKNIKVQPKQNFGTSNELKKRILELQQTVEEKDKEVTRLQKKLDSYQKILPGHHAVQKLKCQLNRSFEVSSPDKRRHTLTSLSLSTSNNLSSISTFKMPFAKFPSDDGKFMSTEETALHFQKLTSEREARYSGGLCDKEVQTDAQRFTTPKRTNSAATSCDTPVQTLRLTTSILRDAYETDALEWTDRMSFLEEENKMLRSLEAENKAILEDATKKIETLNAEKIELENDVLRQMQASKKEMHRRVADSAEYGELQRKLQELSSKIDIITTAAEAEKQELQTEMTEQKTRYEDMVEQNKAEISKLMVERKETEEKYCLLQSSEKELEAAVADLQSKLEASVADLQSKLDAVTKSAEEEKVILQDKLSKVSKEREEFEAKCLSLESSQHKLKESSNQLLNTEKKILEEELHKCQAEVARLEDELKELSSKIDIITTAAEAEKQELETEMTQQKTRYEDMVEQNKVEMSKLMLERKETEAKYCLLESSEKELEASVADLQSKLEASVAYHQSKLDASVADHQSKLDAVTKSAEEEKVILQDKLSKVSKEREEFEAKCLSLESSQHKLKESSNQLLNTEKKILEEELHKCQAEVARLEDELKELSSKIDIITTAAEAEKQELETEMTQQKTRYEDMVEQNKAEISKLIVERKEIEEKYCLLESTEKVLEASVADLQSKLDALTKSAEEDKVILQDKLSKVSKEREEFEDKCLVLESSELKLKESFNQLLNTEKKILEEELHKCQAEVERLEDELKELSSKIDIITTAAEAEKQELETEMTEQKTRYEDMVEQNKAEISKLMVERKETEEKYCLLQSSEKELEAAVADLQSKLDAMTKSAEEDKVILQDKLSECTSNFDNIIQQMKSEISKVSKEREEFEDKCLMLESSELKLKESFNQLLTVEKGILEKELQERQAEVTRLQDELKALKETPLPQTPGTAGRQKIKVNRNVQCDLWKDDEAYCNDLRRAAMAYRTRAQKAEGDLGKLGDTVQLLNEKDSRISELEASIERLEKDVRDLNKIILDSVPDDDGKQFGFERGIQCDLLDDLIEDAKTSEEKRSLLPASIAKILTLRSEVKATKDKNHHLYGLLRRYESQQEQAAAAGGLLSSTSQSRSNLGIAKPRPPSGLDGPLRKNFVPAGPFQFPSSKPKLRTPSQFINQPLALAVPETQLRDSEEVENVPLHPPTLQISNMESSDQKKKHGNDNTMPSHMNPKRLKISSAPTATTTIQSKSMAGEVTSSSISHSSNIPTNSLVTSVSSSIVVQPPVFLINSDDDSDPEDFMEFLNNQMRNTEKQSQPVSLPEAPAPPPQQPARDRLILEESDEEEDEESWLEFYDKLNKEQKAKEQQINN